MATPTLNPDDLRSLEDTKGMVGGGDTGRIHTDGVPDPAVNREFDQIVAPENYQQNADDDQEESAIDKARDTYDRAKDFKKKIDDARTPKEVESGGSTPGGPEGEGISPTSGAPSDVASGLGDAAKTGIEDVAKQGAQEVGKTGARAAGELAGSAMPEAAAVTAGGTQAAAGGAGGAGAAAAAGGAASAAATGTAGMGAGGVAAVTGAGAATGAGVAVTTGAETAGVGAVIGIGIVAATFVGGFMIKNRKVIAQFSGTVFIGVLLLIVSFLNSFKPIASTIETADKYLGPAASIVTTRAVPILARFSTGGSSAAVAMNQQQIAQTQNLNGGNVLAATSDGLVTGGKLKDLFQVMKDDGFEARILKLYGLEFKTGSPGTVTIVVDGKTIGEAHNATEAETILRNKFDKLQLLIDQEFNIWSWAQHTKVARTLRSTYGMGLNVQGAIDAQTPDQLVEVVKYQVSTILTPGLANLKRGIQCFVTGTNCNNDNVTVKNTGSLAKSNFQDDEESSITTATQAAYDKNLEDIAPESDYTFNRLDDLSQEEVSGKLDNKAVGILGWLDITASLSAMSQIDEAQQILSIMRGRQSAVLSTWTLSAVNQMLASDSTPMASSLITRNFENIEDSQAYNYVAYDDTTHGIPMLESQKVLSNLERPFQYVYDNLVIDNPLLKGVLRIAFNFWLVVRIGAGPLITLAKHTPIGSFLNTAIGNGFSSLGVTKTIENILGVSSGVLLPVCDPADRTHNWFNCFATGMHQAANDACAVLGCGKITLAQENELKLAHRTWQQNRLASLPLQTRLFDNKVPNSFINVAAMQSPMPMRSTTNVASFVQGVFGAVWSAPQRVAFLSAQPAYAADADSSDIDGIGHEGIPIATLRTTPLASQLSATGTGAACPEQKKGDVSMCVADNSTADILYARYTHDPTYGGR